MSLAFLIWVYRRIRREMSMQYVANLETQRQREILSVTLSSIGDAVIVTDMGGNITFMNPVAETLTGWPASEAEETPCSTVFRLITEKDRKPIPNPVEKILTTGRIAGVGSHTLLIRRDGSEIPIDDSGAPIRQSDGSLRGVVLTFPRLHRAQGRREHADRGEGEKTEEAARAKDRFIATLSHELLTPHPGPCDRFEWRAGSEFPDKLREGLELIRRNVDLEARLIDDLLDLTRIQSGKLKGASRAGRRARGHPLGAASLRDGALETRHWDFRFRQRGEGARQRRPRTLPASALEHSRQRREVHSGQWPDRNPHIEPRPRHVGSRNIGQRHRHEREYARENFPPIRTSR